MEPVRRLTPEQRRELQAEAGIVIQRRPVPSERRTKEMENQTVTPNPNARPSRAQQTLERLTAPPTFGEVAAHELKRAAVWVPILLSAGTTMLWMNKRFFLPKVG